MPRWLNVRGQWPATSTTADAGYGRYRDDGYGEYGAHSGANERVPGGSRLRQCFSTASTWLDRQRYNLTLQRFFTMATVFSAVLYVAETYFTVKASLPIGLISCDLAITAMFVVDLLLNLYWRRLRLLGHVFSQRMALDVVAIAPGIVTLSQFDMHRTPFVHVLKVARILRLIQQTDFLQADADLTSRPQYSRLLRGRVVWFLVSLFILLFISASLVLTLERGYANGRLSWRVRELPEPSADGGGIDGGAFGGLAYYFHEALYFIVVTFSTVGFGDISPECAEAQVLMIVIIVSAFLIVPYQVNKLAEAIGEYQRASEFSEIDSPPAGASLVIICGSGSLRPLRLRTVLDELFHPDHLPDNANLIAVVLTPTEPTREARALLERYAGRAQLLIGSALSEPDLLRARVTEAEAVFILVDTNAHEQLALDEDAATVLRALTVRHVAPDAHLFVQLLRPDNEASLSASLPLHLSSVICAEQLTMSLLAHNAVCPGVSTLLSNLTWSLSPGARPVVLPGGRDTREARARAALHKAPWWADAASPGGGLRRGRHMSLPTTTLEDARRHVRLARAHRQYHVSSLHGAPLVIGSRARRESADRRESARGARSDDEGVEPAHVGTASRRSGGRVPASLSLDDISAIAHEMGLGRATSGPAGADGGAVGGGAVGGGAACGGAAGTREPAPVARGAAAASAAAACDGAAGARERAPPTPGAARAPTPRTPPPRASGAAPACGVAPTCALGGSSLLLGEIAAIASGQCVGWEPVAGSTVAACNAPSPRAPPASPALGRARHGAGGGVLSPGAALRLCGSRRASDPSAPCGGGGASGSMHSTGTPQLGASAADGVPAELVQRMAAASQLWQFEYAHGASHELYAVTRSDDFPSVAFREAALLVFRKFGYVLMAVDRPAAGAAGTHRHAAGDGDCASTADGGDGGSIPDPFALPQALADARPRGREESTAHASARARADAARGCGSAMVQLERKRWGARAMAVPTRVDSASSSDAGTPSGDGPSAGARTGAGAEGKGGSSGDRAWGSERTASASGARARLGAHAPAAAPAAADEPVAPGATPAAADWATSTSAWLRARPAQCGSSPRAARPPPSGARHADVGPGACASPAPAAASAVAGAVAGGGGGGGGGDGGGGDSRGGGSLPTRRPRWHAERSSGASSDASRETVAGLASHADHTSALASRSSGDDAGPGMGGCAARGEACGAEPGPSVDALADYATAPAGSPPPIELGPIGMDLAPPMPVRQRSAGSGSGLASTAQRLFARALPGGRGGAAGGGEGCARRAADDMASLAGGLMVPPARIRSASITGAARVPPLGRCASTGGAGEQARRESGVGGAAGGWPIALSRRSSEAAVPGNRGGAPCDGSGGGGSGGGAAAFSSPDGGNGTVNGGAHGGGGGTGSAAPTGVLKSPRRQWRESSFSSVALPPTRVHGGMVVYLIAQTETRATAIHAWTPSGAELVDVRARLDAADARREHARAAARAAAAEARAARHAAEEGARKLEVQRLARADAAAAEAAAAEAARAAAAAEAARAVAAASAAAALAAAPLSSAPPATDAFPLAPETPSDTAGASARLPAAAATAACEGSGEHAGALSGPPAGGAAGAPVLLLALTEDALRARDFANEAAARAAGTPLGRNGALPLVERFALTPPTHARAAPLAGARRARALVAPPGARACVDGATSERSHGGESSRYARSGTDADERHGLCASSARGGGRGGGPHVDDALATFLEKAAAAEEAVRDTLLAARYLALCETADADAAARLHAPRALVVPGGGGRAGRSARRPAAALPIVEAPVWEATAQHVGALRADAIAAAVHRGCCVPPSCAVVDGLVPPFGVSERGAGARRGGGGGALGRSSGHVVVCGALSALPALMRAFVALPGSYTLVMLHHDRFAFEAVVARLPLELQARPPRFVHGRPSSYEDLLRAGADCAVAVIFLAGRRRAPFALAESASMLSTAHSRGMPASAAGASGIGGWDDRLFDASAVTAGRALHMLPTHWVVELTNEFSTKLLKTAAATVVRGYAGACAPGAATAASPRACAPAPARVDGDGSTGAKARAPLSAGEPTLPPACASAPPGDRGGLIERAASYALAARGGGAPPRDADGRAAGARAADAARDGGGGRGVEAPSRATAGASRASPRGKAPAPERRTTTPAGRARAPNAPGPPRAGSRSHWWPLFAAGRVYYSSVLDSLLAQAFFNPGMLRLLNQMLKPRTAADARAPRDGAAPRGHIVQLSVPRACADRPYAELFEEMVAEGKVCLGLYREAGHHGCPLPFVYTNPTPESIVNARDRVYVLDAAMGVVGVEPASGAGGAPAAPSWSDAGGEDGEHELDEWVLDDDAIAARGTPLVLRGYVSQLAAPHAFKGGPIVVGRAHSTPREATSGKYDVTEAGWSALCRVSAAEYAALGMRAPDRCSGGPSSASAST